MRKIKNVLITILAALAILGIGSSTAKAETVTISPSKTMYSINNEHRMYRYVETNGNYQNIFCFNYGQPLNENSVYTVSADIYNLPEDQINNLFGSVSNYNKALWIADNMFITESQSKDEMLVMTNQLKEALHSDVALNAIRETYNIPQFEAKDIDSVIDHVYLNGWYNVLYSVEQCVFWNYTNNVNSFSGLTSLNGGYDLEGKYYMWLYTGLKAVADTKGEYVSPNKTNSVAEKIANISIDSSSATINIEEQKVGPFVVNNYDSEMITKKSYTVNVNGTDLQYSDYEVSFEGENLYVIIKSPNYNLRGARVTITLNITGVATTGSLLYKNESQEIVSFHKTLASKALSATTDNSEFDLRLIKNIAGVWSTYGGKATVKYDMSSQELKSRNIQRLHSLKDGATTESWNINKYPVDVATGDVVKYAITVVNEGNLNGYATVINDYIMDGLELVSKDELISLGILNSDSEYYNWVQGERKNGFTKLSSNYLENQEIKSYNIETDEVDSKVIYVYCKVTSDYTGELLKNVAEIATDRTSDLNGIDIDDRDSYPGNINVQDLSQNWKGNSGNIDILSTDINQQYNYIGKEDDDDFDTVRVQSFDLALTKEITAVEDEYENVINLSRINSINDAFVLRNTSNTAIYYMDKSLVTVVPNSIVTYRIAVYNEGTVDGFVKEITDYLPAGLEFYSSEVNGVDYNWNVTKNEDGTTVITTDYLQNERINAISQTALDSKYVEVKCKVTSEEDSKILSNVAEITNYGYYIGDNYIDASKENVDRDSVEKSIQKDVKTIISEYESKINERASNLNKVDTNYQDDDDFENVVVNAKKELDLALRKSISKVNGSNVVNEYKLSKRLPRIEDSTITELLLTGNAAYCHNKQAIEVNVNDEITYTIRVFNEGNQYDYCGYAKTITDFLPEGMEFVRLDDSSVDEWSTESKAGDNKVVLNYNSNKTLNNNSIIKGSTEYQTVSIICKVTGSGKIFTNRAEITEEVATDKEGNVIEGIVDRDSTSGSLNEANANLDSYYEEYESKFGINDTYVNYYPGEENASFEDDVDFEAIYVEKVIEYGKVGVFKYEDTNKNGEYDDEDKALRGAKFALKDSDNQFVTEELETNEFGQVVFEGLEMGKKYYLVETYTPTGFKKLEDSIEVVAVKEEVNFEDITNLVKVGNEAITTEINVLKVWDDKNNADGIRPEIVTVNLYADGKKIKTETLSQENKWEYAFKDLNKYAEGKEIAYTVDEEDVPGYEKEIITNRNVYYIKNTHKIKEKIEVSGTKIWEDNNNQDGVRPESVIIKLFANGKLVESKAVTAEDDWKYTFTNLDKVDNNEEEIVYTVDEESVTSYKKEISGFDIINRYLPKLTEVNGIKIWDDKNNQDGIRPESITVRLLANGKEIKTAEVTSKNNWKFRFTELPQYENGKEIVYTIDEEVVPGYEKTITKIGSLYSITNTHEPGEKTEIRGTKKWVDNNNQDGIRPDSITVLLYANGKEIDSKIVTAKEGWKYSFTNLDLKDLNGDVVTYTVDEVDVPGYQKEINGYDIVNKYEVKTIDVNVLKVWDDNNNADEIRPETVTVNLYADGKKVKTETLSEENKWEYRFKQLNKYAAGKEIVYTVDEEDVPGYEKEIITNGNVHVIKNIHKIEEKTEVSGTKTWDDGFNQDGIRPDSIVVKLLANGSEVDSKIVTAEDDWKYTFADLAAKDKNGQEIVYTIDEEDVPGYQKQINGYDIVNSYDPKLIEINVLKVWDDNNDEDGIRPESINVSLYVNGMKTKTVALSKENKWQYSFVNLNKYSSGKEISYTIDEEDVPGYQKEIVNVNTVYYIKNIHTPGEKTEVVGKKIWSDNNNQDGLRPKSITVTLLANGKEIESQEVTEEDNWQYSFTDLDLKNEDGETIKYTIDEKEVPEYEKEITNNGNVYNITNTHVTQRRAVQTITVSGTKTWVDENNKDGIRPKSIEIKLYANGKKQASVVTSADSNWQYTFDNLPKLDENGEEIVYTIDEDDVEGYAKKIDGYNITNTHIVKKKADLALRKFITEINGIELESSREPQVDTSTIATRGTATYTHPKDAVVVNTGDVVTYTLRIYNEGKIDAHASIIEDSIPEGLEFIASDTVNPGWKMLDSKGNEVSDTSKAKFVVTENIANELINAYNGETLDYKDVKVSFKVISEDVTEKELINFAQISEETDAAGNIIEDSDSTANVWVEGEDDQDIEKVKLTYCDLALRKFITNINDTAVENSREPALDVTPLNNESTTATYTHPKDVVGVSKDDIVRYTIRIYNEGTKSEYVTLVKDSIPEGLEFVATSELNQKYGWVMVDELGNEVQFAANAKYVVTDYLSTDLIKAYNNEETPDYRDVEVEFKVVAEEKSSTIMTNNAQISDYVDENGRKTADRDSVADAWNDGEDDQDIESVKLTYADLALRKFITNVNGEALQTSREPQVDASTIVATGNATYTHPKNAVEVKENDIVTYTLRVYNEGTKSLYATKVRDDIPEGLEFVTYTEGDGSINDTYKWKLLDENNNEVSDTSKAKYIVTEAIASDLIKAYDNSENLDYKDVKVEFKVLAPSQKNQTITNYAQIAEEKDQTGSIATDIDSTANVWNEGEDDQDTEVIKLKYFDLALQKWVSQAIIAENGKEKVVKTGYTSETNPEPVVKVDLKKSKINNVTVKFKYDIKVTNEGEIAGYAKEVEDRIPAGLQFVQEDNSNWEVVDGRIVTHELANTLLEPGESATVSIVLTWINKSNNLGLKTNIAEITDDADASENQITDIDSETNNNVDSEDDQDDAAVMLTIKTGEATVYTGLILGVILILGIGIFNIKKYVLK